jgi:hypothetical protein
MLYHRVMEIVPRAAGVDAMVAWYDDDPDTNPRAAITLYDAIPLDAVNLGQVTAAMVDGAIIARQQQMEAAQAAAVPMRAEITATIGRTRVVRDGRVERHERKRR